MRSLLALSLALSVAGVAEAQVTANPAGQLQSGSGTGYTGAHRNRNFVPGMRFPLRDMGWANSQVYGYGGGLGPGGGQCDSRNYSFPWQDNYCETRSSDRGNTTLCSSRRVHRGQDIRPNTCANNTHAAVAAESGRIVKVGYNTELVSDAGTRYQYLHMTRHQVRVGQRVNCGDILGYVSNLSPSGVAYTTYHLHFNILQAFAGVSSMRVPPYTALVDSGRRLGTSAECGGAPVDAGVMDSATPPPPEEGSCFSSTLNRRVNNGQCVQVERGACGDPECGIYQCVDGRWTCPVSTCTETVEHPMCEEPDPPPDTCRSATLGRDVANGECVQVNDTARPGEPAMCSGGCGWYRCDAGSWQCVDMSACGGATNPNAACTAPERRSCRSSTLGRNVDDGACVQVNGTPRSGEPAACSSGCGWYRCDDGGWTCVNNSECGGEQFDNASCGETGMQCSSSTLGRNVDHGDRVQVSRAACGESSCGWYECNDGRWDCTDGPDGSGMSFENSACGEPTPGTGPTLREVAASLGTSCSTSGGDGLGRQLADTQMCMYPDAFISILPHPRITLTHGRVRPFMQPAAAEALRRVADRVPVQLNSTFRPVSDQYLLHESCTGPAAAPGGSNHQGGLAVDVRNTAAVRRQMTEEGFRWFGSRDKPHYDYTSGTERRADAVRAFQQLWNVNNPDDEITVDGVYGAETARRLGDSPAAGFPLGGCDEPDMCNMNEDCDACNQAAGCGWCETSGECQSDSMAGMCDEWLPDRSSCEPCDATSCEACAASGFCSWCPGSGCINDSIPSAVEMCGGDLISNPGGCG